MAEVNVENSFADVNSATCYLRRDDLPDAVDAVHQVVKDSEHLSCVSTRAKVAVVHVADIQHGEESDSVRRFAVSLLDSAIEILDAEMASNSMTVYLAWDDRHHVEDLLQSAVTR